MSADQSPRNDADQSPRNADRERCDACAGTGMDRLGDLPCSGCGGYGYLPNPIRPRPA